MTTIVSDNTVTRTVPIDLSLSASASQMTFALDYDGTATGDLEMWVAICRFMRQRGHRVYIVTMRYPSECSDISAALLQNVDGLYPTSRMSKKEHIGKQGIDIHVWIDDNPIAVYQSAGQIWGQASPEGHVVIEHHENKD